MKLLPGSSNFHIGTGSSDIKKPAAEQSRPMAFSMYIYAPNYAVTAVNSKGGPLYIMEKNKNVNTFCTSGLHISPLGGLRFPKGRNVKLPGEKCKAPWGEM